MDLIRNLKELRKENIPLAGGKGANLGELVYAKMPVPPGFVVTTVAYDDFVNQNNLKKVITENLQNKNDDGKSIRNAFIESQIPEEVKSEVLKAYNKLGKGPVAVRSSATAEDLPGASFAGQQETYLNITGEKELLDAVRLTWASLWTKRAISYRYRQRINQKKVKLAVVVERMVDADFAGVMFTANPINGNRGEIVIDANPGLGEALVSGLVTPDHFVMRHSWRGWHFVKNVEGKRELIIKSKKGGGTERIEKSEDTSELPKNVLVKLAEFGIKIEKHFGSPQDIEWVWSDEKIQIVQSRPITALPDELPKQNKINKMLSGMIAEMMPKRQLPLESTLFSIKLVINIFLKPFLKLIGLRIPPTKEFLIEEDGIFVRYNGKIKLYPTISIIGAPFRLLYIVFKYNSSDWEKDQRVTETIKQIKELECKNYKKLSNNGIIDITNSSIKIFRTIFEVRILYLPRAVLYIAILGFILLLIGKKQLLSTLLFLDIETKVTETNNAINYLVSKIREDKILFDIFTKNSASDVSNRLKNIENGREFLHEFQIFLDKYGYRESRGIMFISEPTWKESPEIVLGILKTLTSAPFHKKTKDTFESVRDKIISQSILRFQPLHSIFIKLLNTARHFQEIRENTRFYLMMVIPTLRRAILELGSRLTEAKILTTPQDVFYLKFEELTEIVKNLPLQDVQINEWVSLISKRKLKYNSLKNIPIVDLRLYRTQNSKEGAIAVGTPGSPGIVEGTARIIHNSSEFSRLQPDDILVAPYTNPAWTPLFETATGVVVDTGGSMSHAAIVAREYGIPAVMGTVDGTKKIKNGDKIRVNGTEGSVFTLDSATD